MFSTIKISESAKQLAAQAASVNSRSISAQVEHWMKIGRAIEQSPGFNYERVQKALHAELNQDELSEEELAIYEEALFSSMYDLTDQFTGFIENQKAKGLGVGLDDEGNLVHQNHAK